MNITEHSRKRKYRKKIQKKTQKYRRNQDEYTARRFVALTVER
jgi:hypothetical protein